MEPAAEEEEAALPPATEAEEEAAQPPAKKAKQHDKFMKKANGLKSQLDAIEKAIGVREALIKKTKLAASNRALVKHDTDKIAKWQADLADLNRRHAELEKEYREELEDAEAR